MSPIQVLKRPAQPLETSIEQLRSADIDVQDSVALLGIRGYYRDAMGVVGKNDRKIYDDAIFIISPNTHTSFNANTDPCGEGWNANISPPKPYATLKPGVWNFEQGWHKRNKPGGHKALRQPVDFPFTVLRDAAKGQPSYEESGYFAINLHRGGEWSTSSYGCQTIVASQWEAFVSLVYSEMKRYNQKIIKYLLIAAEE